MEAMRHTNQMENIMQITFDWVKPARGRSGRIAASGLKVVRNDYKDKDSGLLRTSTVVRFSPDVMKKARFVIGDRVLVGTATIGGEKFLAVRRVPDGGYAISGAQANKGKAKPGHAKIGTDTLPLGEWETDHVEITDEGILLVKIADGVQIDKT